MSERREEVMNPVIVVEARKEGGWRVAVRTRLDVAGVSSPALGVYLWQRVAGTVGNVTTFLEFAATFRDKMLAQKDRRPAR